MSGGQEEAKNEVKNEEKAAEAKRAPAAFRGILGEKVGMTQIYHPKTKHICDVTVVKAGPCPVMRVKTAEGKDGYNAVQLAYGSRKEKNIPEPQLAQYKKLGLGPARFVREIRGANAEGLEEGEIVVVDGVFKSGDYVDVQALSKGKGFAGVMKRHNFHGLPASHGASDKQRSPGSLAGRRSLGRVLPGQRMAGHMGHEKVTVHKLEVIRIDANDNLIYVQGSVPGPRGGMVTIRETAKSKKFRVDAAKSAVKRDKMGNIIGKKPTAAKK